MRNSATMPDYLKPLDPTQFGEVVIHAPTAAELVQADDDYASMTPEQKIARQAMSFLNHPSQQEPTVIIHAQRAGDIVAMRPPENAGSSQ